MPTHYDGTPEQRRALDTYIKLLRAAETTLAHTTAHLARYNLTVSQMGVLEALYHLGTLNQCDLATKLLKSTGNISLVLKKLEQRGLVTRQRDPHDNRYNEVRLTPAGEDLLLSFFNQHVAGIVAAMSALSPHEQAVLGDLCRTLGRSMTAAGEPASKSTSAPAPATPERR